MKSSLRCAWAIHLLTANQLLGPTVRTLWPCWPLSALFATDRYQCWHVARNLFLSKMVTSNEKLESCTVQIKNFPVGKKKNKKKIKERKKRKEEKKNTKKPSAWWVVRLCSKRSCLSIESQPLFEGKRLVNVSDLAEDAEHVFLKTEFDLKIIMLLLEHLKQFLLIRSNTNCPCFNVYRSCFTIKGSLNKKMIPKRIVLQPEIISECSNT